MISKISCTNSYCDGTSRKNNLYNKLILQNNTDKGIKETVLLGRSAERNTGKTVKHLIGR